VISWIGENTYGTCLGQGSGGPDGRVDCAEGEIPCGDCGGFCLDPAENVTCRNKAYEKLAGGTCSEGIANGGSCAKDGYNSQTKSCEMYCTNIIGMDDRDCSADAGRPEGTCVYIGPEDPRYSVQCPEGNGWTEFGWNDATGCFDDAPAEANVVSYYCPCPGNDCTNVSLGSGCQGSATVAGGTEIVGEACYLPGECGILQVDVDYPGNPNGTEHTSRNLLITSGCNVTETPVEETGGPVSSPPPTSPPPATGPQCLDIKRDIANPEVGDTVTFTCGTVPPAGSIQAMYYAFRLQRPDGSVIGIPNINPISSSQPSVGTIQAQYTIDMPGSYKAQCTICPDGTCYDFEPLSGVN